MSAFDISDISNVTAIIVSRWTLRLTKQCVESLLAFHPTLLIVLVDNKSGSDDPSLQYCRSVALEHDNITLVENVHRQPHHGTGLNLGVSKVRTSLFLTVDSDTMLQDGSLLARMMAPFSNAEMFASGHVWRGAAWNCLGSPRPGQRTTDFVHPFFAMWSTPKFNSLGVGFSKVGMPTCHLCKKALARGYKLHKVEGVHPRNRDKHCHVRHLGGGTRARMGRKRR